MTAFVTGATGFIGRHLLELLLKRDGDVHVLVRASSRPKVDALAQRLGAGERIKAVTGDLTQPALGIQPAWLDANAGEIDHLFHLAAVYDMAASAEANEAANVGGTRATVEVANRLGVGTLHHVSSVAAAGDYEGRFTERMFDEGQPLRHPYHRTKFESERIAREESTVPWRVYRPAIVLGHSQTGEMDKVDGPYYFFPALKAGALGGGLGSQLRLLAPRFGRTNMVPVDYVVAALDHIAHTPGLDGTAFHLVDPVGQSTISALNTFAAAAGAPRLVGVLPRAVVDLPLKAGPVRGLLAGLGIPAAALEHADFTATFDAKHTLAALHGTDIRLPPLSNYAGTLYAWWRDHMAAG